MYAYKAIVPARMRFADVQIIILHIKSKYFKLQFKI